MGECTSVMLPLDWKHELLVLEQQNLHQQEKRFFMVFIIMQQLTRVYKQIFYAIVQMWTEHITNNYDNTDHVLGQNFLKFRKKIGTSNITNVFQLSEFKSWKNKS